VSSAINDQDTTKRGRLVAGNLDFGGQIRPDGLLRTARQSLPFEIP
jgi:hypothetical protein